ncbi:MAG TPA: DinB family protein [Anaerolineales bacterium]|nr:DinB family protein [Anaerolineales bacterium]
MTDSFLLKIFEHNNWANQQIIQACAALSEEQLDAEPQSATQGSIRSTLMHLVSAQRGYLSLLTLPVEARPNTPLDFAELQESVTRSGEGLLALVGDQDSFPKDQLQTRDGYYVDSRVVILQIINHATEHREQIKSMLSALGVTPPNMDGWDYGEVTKALIPISA